MIFLISSELPQQGKDTFAEYMQKNYKTSRIAIADTLKEICLQGGWDSSKEGKGRQLLIDVGLAFRKYEEDIWVNSAIKKMRKEIKDGYSVCVTDCRFLNEINKIKNSFTRTPIVHIGITSDELGDRSRKNDDSQKDFKEMIFDYNIKTTADKNHLYKEIENILKSEREKIRGGL
jgi:hypothetical protein